MVTWWHGDVLAAAAPDDVVEHSPHVTAQYFALLDCPADPVHAFTIVIRVVYI